MEAHDRHDDNGSHSGSLWEEERWPQHLSVCVPWGLFGTSRNNRMHAEDRKQSCRVLRTLLSMEPLCSHRGLVIFDL